ncbi:MAG: tetratricopeptide repeat protein, partial [Muribaculaceae bacterium]|nr:tetratricopeptide repeat protein [Muribaculaceae bacterium]
MKSGRLGRRLLTAMALAMSVNVFGAPIDDAKALYEQGDYAAALEKLQTLAKRSPRDTNVNYYLGATLQSLGNEEQPVE